MKKVMIVFSALLISVSVMAQKGKTTKPATAKASSSSVSKADANNFIRYANSITQFFKSSYQTETFINRYEQILQGDENGTRGGIPQDYFSAQYDDFNQAHKNSSTEDLLPLDEIPAKIGAEKITKIKTAFANLKTAHADLSAYFTNTVVAKFPKGIPPKDKKKQAEAEPIMAELKTKIKTILSIQEELTDIASELGDMAEEITLANHPMKKEIIDLRTTMRISNSIAQLGNVETREELIANEAKINEKIALLIPYQKKYENIDTKSANNKQYAMKEQLKTFFGEDIPHFIEVTQKSIKIAKDKEVNNQYWKSENRRIASSFESMIVGYRTFVETNNRD